MHLLNHSSEAMTLTYLGLDQASRETMLDQIDFGNECLELSSRPKTTTFFVESSKDDSMLLTCKNRIE